ncbi:lysylphosphatidylglycerol synthase domain-containing protein [Nocardioides sp.]|uniref:lysylphosphatidylglycerol synthase domain-containing protein n=1 Tax=Nocardioides sp. TaxID=35761 RepID=UPI00261B7683|nr:lysylphosphatidylglycerol synthase domain-containing protein [Nocardioides sp.]
MSTPEASPRRVLLRRAVHLTLTAGCLSAIGLFFPHLLGTSWAGIAAAAGAVSPLLVALLLLVWALGLGAHTITACAALPGLSHRRALLLSLTGSAVANVLPVGGAAGIALNGRMTKRWGFSTASFASFTVVTNVWNILAKAFLPLILVPIALALGAAVQQGSALLIASAVTVPLIGGLTAWLLFGRSALPRLRRRLGLPAAGSVASAESDAAAGGRSEAALEMVGAGGALPTAEAVRTVGTLQTLDAVETVQTVETFQNAEEAAGEKPRTKERLRGLAHRFLEACETVRERSAALARTRWHQLSFGLLLYMGLLLVLLVLCLHAGGATVPIGFVLLAFCGERLLTLAGLTPGGLGVVELGLAAVLMMAPGATAAGVGTGVLIYRLLTFGLEIPVGGALLALWMWFDRSASSRSLEGHLA